jgi:hypothetical protein
VKITQVKDTTEVWPYFYEFCVKSKPYDFCSLKSKVLRDYKIRNVFKEFSSYKIYKAEKEDGPFGFSFVKEEQVCLDLVFIFGISSKASSLKLASSARLLLKKVLEDSDKAYLKSEIRRTFKVGPYKKWIEKYYKNAIILNDENNTVIFCNKNIMTIKFKVVGTNKATEHLVGKDAFLKSTRKVKHGLLREITIDEKIYLLDEKGVDFLSESVLLNGLISDNENNVGNISLQFIPNK